MAEDVRVLRTEGVNEPPCSMIRLILRCRRIIIINNIIIRRITLTNTTIDSLIMVKTKNNSNAIEITRVLR